MIKRFIYVMMAISLSISICVSMVKAKSADFSGIAETGNFQEYLDYFQQVFDFMDQNYYTQVSQKRFDHFVEKWKNSIYNKLKSEGKSDNYVRWRSAAYLVDNLKQPDDSFSALYPPVTVEEFKQEVYDTRVDLGIEGELLPVGYSVTRIEPRSDAYQKGLRVNDLIMNLNGKDVKELGEQGVYNALHPLEGEGTQIGYLDSKALKLHFIDVVYKEFYAQSVFECPMKFPGVYCLELRKFNRKTGEDMFRFMEAILRRKPIGLILDLRGNPGGPPLAAREISSFFLEPESELVYFDSRHMNKAVLDVPKIPEKYRYTGPMVVLVDKGSGSASEMFSGALQYRKRALIMGQETAGSILLKKLFYMDDEAALALMTARGYFPDGTPYSLDGIYPNEYLGDDRIDQALDMASKYLFAIHVKKQQGQ